MATDGHEQVDHPWRAPGEWLRCALHAHTTQSDGELAPALLVEHYARAGYDVLAITDHWRRTDAESSNGLLVVPGAELNCILPEGRDGHVLAFGIDADPAPLGREYADLARTADWIGEHGGVAYLAHPYWTGAATALELPPNVAGIEVYNAGCELEVGRGLSSVHWDELLERGRSCFAIATDDSHHPGFDSDQAWTWVRAPERSQDAVLAALASGSFYGSTGPLFYDVVVADGAVEVSCSAARSVTLLTGKTTGAAVNAGRLGYRYAADVLEQSAEGGITRARLRVPTVAPYGRVEIVDLQGRKAWTNPLW